MPLLRSHPVVPPIVRVALLAASIAAPPALGAQRPPAADSTCTYAQCALRVEGRRLVRGTRGETVAKIGWFAPRPLLPFVTGDSARVHAARYERDSRRAVLLFDLGSLAILGAFIVDQATGGSCSSPIGLCDRPAAINVGVGVTILGGIAAMIDGVRRGNRAADAESRALWWHNATFAR